MSSDGIAPNWITHGGENTADPNLLETRQPKQDIIFDHTLVCANILVYANVEHMQTKVSCVRLRNRLDVGSSCDRPVALHIRGKSMITFLNLAITM